MLWKGEPLKESLKNPIASVLEIIDNNRVSENNMFVIYILFIFKNEINSLTLFYLI